MESPAYGRGARHKFMCEFIPSPLQADEGLTGVISLAYNQRECEGFRFIV